MSLDRQPTLVGTLVELRPLRPADQAALYAVASDPLIWEQHPAKNRHEAAVFAEFFSEALASGGALLVTDARTQRAIGSSRFHGYSEERSEVEIGWTFLARSHWGGRYNGELKQLMLRHAFRFVRSVVFFVGRENLRSRRALDRIGGVLEPEPDAEGRVVYRITASAFARRRADRYWQQFLISLPRSGEPPARYVDAFCFGSTPAGAAEIAELVLAGTKTATGSVLWSYEADGKPIPRSGDHWIVNDGAGHPVCIIRTTDVSILPFDEVPERYAHEGGEADRSLETWRPMYWRYLVSECRRIGREAHPSAPLVMERFVVVYREAPRDA
jgi:uncharacterized protein YhfF